MPNQSVLTIEELLGDPQYFSLSSPRKTMKTLKAAVLTKSPLNDKRTGQGKMFTMTLTDGSDTANTMKAVCFTEKMYSSFDATTTYDIKYFLIKKAYGQLEIQITEDTVVNRSLFQFPIQEMWFKVDQVLRRETKNVKFINIKAKVIDIGEITTVGKYPDQKEKREVVLGDETGHIVLVLWRDKTTTAVNYEQGSSIKIQNALTTTFNNNILLNMGAETVISTLDENIETVPSTSIDLPTKRPFLQEIITTVNAIKDFKCTVRCISCKNDITFKDDTVLDSSTRNEIVITCQTCCTTFKIKPSKLACECQLLLDVNDKWFYATTGVVQHMFQWESPHLNPTTTEITNLMSVRYTMRLNVDGKKIEYAEVTTDDYPEETDNKIARLDHELETAL